MGDIQTTDHTIFIRTNNEAVIDWQIDHYVAGTKVRLDVEPDPGSGKNPVPEAPDANTKPDTGVGHFKMVVGKNGLFAFTLTVAKPDGPEKATVNVSVQPLTIVKLECASGASSAVNQPLTLEWAVDRGQGCTFELVTIGPDKQETRALPNRKISKNIVHKTFAIIYFSLLNIPFWQFLQKYPMIEIADGIRSSFQR